jgi:small subunit ribosomal protein S9
MEKAKKTTKTSATPAAGKKPLAHGVGRRKSSIARIWLRKGSGSLTVNGKDYSKYFDTDVTRMDASSPLRVTPAALKYDFDVNVYGGGVCSQAGAVKLGMARALVAFEEGLRSILRQHGLVTVDARRKERKKYGQKGARRKFQFVKR